MGFSSLFPILEVLPIIPKLQYVLVCDVLGQIIQGSSSVLGVRRYGESSSSCRSWSQDGQRSRRTPEPAGLGRKCKHPLGITWVGNQSTAELSVVDQDPTFVILNTEGKDDLWRLEKPKTSELVSWLVS